MSARIDLEEDKFLQYFSYILIASLAAPVGVQACFTVELFQNSKQTNVTMLSFNATKTLEIFYNNIMKRIWGDFIPYHPVFVVAYILLYFWATLMHMLVPPFIMFFARAISFQYRKMIEIATNTDSSEAHCVDMRKKGNKVVIFPTLF